MSLSISKDKSFVNIGEERTGRSFGQKHLTATIKPFIQTKKHFSQSTRIHESVARAEAVFEVCIGEGRSEKAKRPYNDEQFRLHLMVGVQKMIMSRDQEVGGALWRADI
jgi:hypothetical protein